MRTLTKALIVSIVLASGTAAWSQDIPGSRAAPGNDAPAGPYMLYWGPASQVIPKGKPENEWRYRFHNGRWWFWTLDDHWSYYNGDIWVPYSPQRERELGHTWLLGPIDGPLLGQGVAIRGRMAGLTLIPGDHPAAPHLERGTVLPRYLRQEQLPSGQP
jgi:hypothetical protein